MSDVANAQMEMFATGASDVTRSARDGSSDDRASHLVGALHERALERAGDRKRGGSYYTPPDVVERLLDLCLEPILAERRKQGAGAVAALRVLDPACGSGNFLVAVAARLQRELEDLGVVSRDAARAAFGECVAGIDVDAAAVELCRTSLAHASGRAVSDEALKDQILCANALAIGDAGDTLFPSVTLSWQQVFEFTSCSDGYDLVVGNPPFLSQLAAETVRSDADAARVRSRFGDAVAGLTDTAVLFLLLGAAVVEEQRGTVCLIQPISFLSARDAAPARDRLLDTCGLRSMWICEEKVFDASVRVCAPVLVRGQSFDEITLHRNRHFEVVGSTTGSTFLSGTWSALLATSKGVPERQAATAGTVADLATATADFRDQYYGLRGSVVDLREADDASFPPLVTSGLIDPAAVMWGERSTKFDKTTYECPRVEIAKLDERLQKWARERLRPKLLLATQTKVLEVAVDDRGRFLPSVPVISITVQDPALLWMLGALLTSPPVTLIAARRHLGAALSSEALKLSASDVLSLPLPADESTWSVAAKHFQRGCESRDASSRQTELMATAELMCSAYGMPNDDELMKWWSARLPRPRTA